MGDFWEHPYVHKVYRKLNTSKKLFDATVSRSHGGYNLYKGIGIIKNSDEDLDKYITRKLLGENASMPTIEEQPVKIKSEEPLFEHEPEPDDMPRHSFKRMDDDIENSSLKSYPSIKPSIDYLFNGNISNVKPIDPNIKFDSWFETPVTIITPPDSALELINTYSMKQLFSVFHEEVFKQLRSYNLKQKFEPHRILTYSAMLKLRDNLVEFEARILENYNDKNDIWLFYRCLSYTNRDKMPYASFIINHYLLALFNLLSTNFQIALKDIRLICCWVEGKLPHQRRLAFCLYNKTSFVSYININYTMMDRALVVTSIGK